MQYPESIFNIKTRAYSCIIYIKRKAQYKENNADSFMPHGVLPLKVRKKQDRRITFLVHFNYRKHTERNPFPHLEYWY